MECLGYEKNRAQFLALARAIPIERLRIFSLHDTFTMMAILFGTAGLLPSLRLVKELDSYRYVRGLKRRWRELRGSLCVTALDSSEWLFFRLRPSNFPTARLAGLCYLLPSLFSDDAFKDLIALFAADAPSPDAILRSIHRRFAFQPDSYWSSHFHFLGSRSSRSISLGKGRIDDITVNVLLPLVALYARVFRKGTIGMNCRIVAAAHPPLQENRITRILRSRLFNDETVPNSAKLQQGILELHARFCMLDRCTECAIGGALGAQRIHATEMNRI